MILFVLGFGKVGVEILVMGFGCNVIGVLFWYGVLGGSGVFLYCLIVELVCVWLLLCIIF